MRRDFVMVAKTVIDIGIASNPGSGIYDQIVRVSPLHIVRIESLQAGQGILCILRYCVSRRYFPELRCQRGWTDHAHFALREWNLNPLGAEGIKNVELDLPGGGSELGEFAPGLDGDLDGGVAKAVHCHGGCGIFQHHSVRGEHALNERDGRGKVRVVANADLNVMLVNGAVVVPQYSISRKESSKFWEEIGRASCRERV